MKMIKAIRNMAAVLAALMLGACSNTLIDTEQFQDGVHLNAFGPCPVLRGGELRFIGSNMDKIVSIELPGCGAITDIKRVSSQEIRIEVPQTAEVGHAILTCPCGEVIRTKTPVTYSEPVSIESITPAKVRPGDVIEIKGEYLNLMTQACFSFAAGCDSVNVGMENFLTHSRKAITLAVPAEAATGYVWVSDGVQRIKSESMLEIALPAVAAVKELSEIIPGTPCTVAGTDFDLIKRVLMPNGADVDFTFDASGGAITFVIPLDATDGVICAIPASGVKVDIANLTVAVPTEVTISPDKEVRGGDIISVTGKYVNQILTATVPNVSAPIAVEVVSESEVSFVFPTKGQSGKVVFTLPSGKTIEGRITTAKATVSSLNPTSVEVGGQFTIKGANLDLVSKVTFSGDVTVNVAAETPTELTVTVPEGAKTGPLTLTMVNDESARTQPLTIK